MPLVVRSWNAASLFGADVRDAPACRRHRAKIRFVCRLIDRAHAVALQATRGTAADFLQLRDLLPGWEFRGTFPAHGTFGGAVLLLSPRLIAAYPDRILAEVVLGRVCALRLRGGQGLPLDLCALHSFPTPATTRIQQFQCTQRALAALGTACTILIGDFNCCSAGEGRMDLRTGAVQLGISAESEAIGTIFDSFHEVVPAGFSRIQTRDGAPSTLSTIDRVLTKAPVSELMGGGARAAYVVPVTSVDLPSDHAPLELVVLPTPTRRRRTIPQWAPLHPLYQELMSEAAAAIFAGNPEPFAAISELAGAAFSILPEVKRSRAPPGGATNAWEAHWLTAARSYWGSGSDDWMRDAIAHVPAYAHLCIDDRDVPRANLDEEAIAAHVRALLRSQLLADFADELKKTRNDEEKHATRRRYSRPLEAWGELHRRVSTFGIVCDDGSVAEGVAASASALAAHWSPIFAGGGPIDATAAQRLLHHTNHSSQVSELSPLSFDEFCSVVAHTRNSSPEPGGLPYSVWDVAGTSGRRILYRAYQALLSGVAPPSDFNRSLVVYIPKEADPNAAGIPAVPPATVRPITLSNTSHKLITKAVNSTLERVAPLTVHPAQRGFMPGRGMMEKVFEALAPMHLRDRMTRDHAYCLSVLMFLGHSSRPDARIRRVEAATFASLLAAPMHIVTLGVSSALFVVKSPLRVRTGEDLMRAASYRLALHTDVLDHILYRISAAADCHNALLAPAASAWQELCPLTLALRLRAQAVQRPRDIVLHVCAELVVLRHFAAAEGLPLLRGWLRRRLGHLLGCNVAGGELELVLTRVEWAFRDLPLFVAFAVIRVIANSWCLAVTWLALVTRAYLRRWAETTGGIIQCVRSSLVP